MSLVETYRAEHKARLLRMGAKPAPVVYVAPVRPSPIKPIDPEPFYAGMWFYNLVTMPPISDKLQPLGRIQRAIARHFHISVDELLSDQRTKDVTFPRQIGYLLAREMTVKSTREISRRFNRDHSSITHGIRKIRRMMQNDETVVAHVNSIRAELQA